MRRANLSITLALLVALGMFGFVQWYNIHDDHRDEMIRMLTQQVVTGIHELARCDSLALAAGFDTTAVRLPHVVELRASPVEGLTYGAQALGKVSLSGDTLFVGLLTCTVPSTEQALGQCAGNGVPDSGASFARIQLRANHPDSLWRDGWTVGMAQAAGRSILFPITGIRSATWARLAPVDTAGNQACWSDSALLVPHVVVP